MQILISLINIYGALRKIQCIASVKKIPCVISISLNYLLWYPATGFFRISQSRASLVTLSINCQFGLLVTAMKYSLKCEYANTTVIVIIAPQQIFTCSKSTMETKNDVNDVTLVPLLLTMNILFIFLQCFYC